jgi:hypothetical protein
MAGATNDFLTWALGAGANVESQADYAVDPAQNVGVSAGLASSALYNKQARQAAFVIHCVAEFIRLKQANSPADDGNATEFINNLEAALLGFIFPGGQLLSSQLPTFAYLQHNPANPTGTTSITPVMMGLGGAAVLTPSASGIVKVDIAGFLTDTIAPTESVIIVLYYGTGAAPANGDAVPGSAVEITTIQGGAASTSVLVPWSTQGVVALTPGTQYWFDISIVVQGGGGGIGGVGALSITLLEMP